MKGTEPPLVSGPANAWMLDPAKVAIVRQITEDFDWAMQHQGELERQYPGESIVVWRKQVIAHGTCEEELLVQSTSPERPREELVVVEFPSFESPDNSERPAMTLCGR